jgi:hypothetical protein
MPTLYFFNKIILMYVENPNLLKMKHHLWFKFNFNFKNRQILQLGSNGQFQISLEPPV